MGLSGPGWCLVVLSGAKWEVTSSYYRKYDENMLAENMLAQ